MLGKTSTTGDFAIQPPGFPVFEVHRPLIEGRCRLSRNQKKRLTESQLLDALRGKMPATRKDF